MSGEQLVELGRGEFEHLLAHDPAHVGILISHVAVAFSEAATKACARAPAAGAGGDRDGRWAGTRTQ
ncbi:hypothetical protein GCM10027521_12440 [Amycolatopsis cihanbeyliensis]